MEPSSSEALDGPPTTPQPPPVLGLRTLVGFLFGRAASIRTVATAKSSIWIGLAFVLSAAFAREYDGEDLLAEPWHLAFPLAVSTAAAFLLSIVAFIFRRKPRLPNNQIFPAILRSFWLMAPMAWLYAVPYEQFLSPPHAAGMNLLTLAIVSIWRVALAVRILCVLLLLHPLRAISVVAIAVSVITAILSLPTAAQVFASMGGVFGTEAEEVRKALHGAICCFSPVTFLGFLALATITLFGRHDPPPSPLELRPTRVSRTLLALALGSLVIWTVILPFTQPAQRLRREVEAYHQAKGDLKTVKLLSGYQRGDLPMRWRPLPQVHMAPYGRQKPAPQAVNATLKAIIDEPAPDWLRDHYLTELRRAVRQYPFEMRRRDAIFDELRELLAAVPEADDILDEIQPRN